MYCLKCGYEMKEGDRFCHNCGFPADGTSADIPETRAEADQAKRKTGSKIGLWIGVASGAVVLIAIIVAIAVFSSSSISTPLNQDIAILNGDYQRNNTSPDEITASSKSTESPTPESTLTPSPEATSTPTPMPTPKPTLKPTPVSTEPYKVGELKVTIICNFNPANGIWRGGWVDMYVPGDGEYGGGVGAIDISKGEKKTYTYDIYYYPEYNELSTARYSIALWPINDSEPEDDYVRSTSESYSTYKGLKYLSGLTITLSEK